MKHLHTALSTLCLCGAMAGAFAQDQDRASPEQTWVGQYTIGGKSTAIVLHDRSQSKNAPSVLDIPALGARDIPLAKFTGSRFEMQGGPDLFVFDGAAKGTRLAGGVTRAAANAGNSNWCR